MRLSMHYIGAPVVFAALTTAAFCQDKAPTLADAKALLREMDQAWNKPDLDAYLACFRPIHKRLHNEMVARAKVMLERATGIHRSSKIEKFRQWKDIAIARVRTLSQCSKVEQNRAVIHSYVAMRSFGDGTKALFLTRMNARALQHLSTGKFACPACNYEFGGSEDWLTVPARPDASGCMEALTFVALQHDLTLESSVTMTAMRMPARYALQEYVDRIRKAAWVEKGSTTKVRDWLPPAYSKPKTRPKSLDGARAALLLKSGKRAELFLATFGPIRYLMVVEGKPATIQKQAASIHKLLASFRLLKPEQDPAAILSAANFAHSGKGVFVGKNTYSNKTHNFRISAPKGWTGKASACEHLFRARFSDKEKQASMTVEAMEPPFGFRIWTQELADLVFADWCAGLPVKVDSKTASWRPRKSVSKSSFQWRQVRFKCPKGTGHRVLRMAMRESMLVMIEAATSDLENIDAIVAAMGTIGPSR